MSFLEVSAEDFRDFIFLYCGGTGRGINKSPILSMLMDFVVY